MVIGITTLVSSKELTGLGKYIVHLIEALQKIETNHQFVIFVNRDLDDLIKIHNSCFKKVKINIPHNPRIIMRPFFFLWHNLFFGKLVRRYKIDILHIPNSIPLFNKWGIPNVITIHDVGEFSVKKYTFIRSLLRKLASITSSKKADRIITVSEFSKQEISEYLSISRDLITVIYPGKTLNPYSTIKNGGNKKVKNNQLYFLHVGGNRLNKNLANVIKAFTRINKTVKIHLYSVGKDDTRLVTHKELVLLRKEGIYYEGYISNDRLESLYRNALALIYPSIHEGFGFPILEAMSFGVPIITSNSSSMPEVAGDAALYVNPTDINSIVIAIQTLLEDKHTREVLVKKGLYRSRKFNWNFAAEKTINLYEEIHKKF